MPLIELTLPAGIDEVWRHLREPALIRRWFGWDYDGLDHEIEVIFLQEATVGSYELDWGDPLQGGDRIVLAEAGPDTLLRVHREPAGGFDAVAEGWISFAHQLRFALEHEGERRTLRLTGGRPRADQPGEPYFQTELQTATVVDGALLLVAAGADGSAAMTLSAYGGEPDEGRWRAWWEA
jgi:uncharacterized protein YndB with AHSA1/START domain